MNKEEKQFLANLLLARKEYAQRNKFLVRKNNTSLLFSLWSDKEDKKNVIKQGKKELVNFIQENKNQKNLETIFLLAPSPAIYGYGKKKEIQKRQPQLLSQVLDIFKKNEIFVEQITFIKIKDYWKEIVGIYVAEKTTIEKYENKVLTIKTSTTAFKTSLAFLESTIRQNINNFLGFQFVEKIKFLGPNTPSWKHGKLSVRGGRGPRDTYG